MDYRERITIEPGKRSGKPCIRGLRITVYDVLDYLAGGMSEEQILADFPDLEREDIRAALAFAADRSPANARMSPCRARSTASTSSVVQFPSRTQITFGGAPRTKPRWRKSSSFVTIANPPSAACRQTASSSAACRLS